ncbi:hypothetical protein [Kitasatospora sp. NPDC057223]|uniref:hypothetical protein n=1 Tax=Kitasatospora sp. NPDC057223 TaxID=3346055 RepID=UPI003643D68E
MIQLLLDARMFVSFRDHEFAQPGAHGYRWVDVRVFGTPRGASDGELLTALVAHEQFRDDYAGGGVDPAGTRHGPYWLTHVTAHAYDAVSSTEALSTLRGWAGQHGTVPEPLEETLAAQVFAAVESATTCYRLRNLGKRAFHDWGGVHTDFHEYVVVDRERALLRLVVATDD